METTGPNFTGSSRFCGGAPVVVVVSVTWAGTELVVGKNELTLLDVEKVVRTVVEEELSWAWTSPQGRRATEKTIRNENLNILELLAEWRKERRRIVCQILFYTSLVKLRTTKEQVLKECIATPYNSIVLSRTPSSVSQTHLAYNVISSCVCVISFISRHHQLRVRSSLKTT